MKRSLIQSVCSYEEIIIMIGTETHATYGQSVKDTDYWNTLMTLPYLIMPACESGSVQDELNHIAKWSRENDLQLNNSNSQEIIFVARNKHPTLPDPIIGPIQVDCIKVLGVYISNRVTARDHVTLVIQVCSRSLHALKILRSHGLTGTALSIASLLQKHWRN